MSENKSIKILMDDDSSEENHKSAKELEDDKRAEKEAQQKLVSITSKQTISQTKTMNNNNKTQRTDKQTNKSRR